MNSIASDIGDRTTPALDGCRALILNADFRPLSYFPLSVLGWQDAIRALVRGSVHVVSEYDRAVHSPGMEIKIPSVLALKEYVPRARAPAFTRFNLFLRDEWTCQYCATHLKTHELTFDHVIPRSKGGGTNWENIVAACQPCNRRKSDKLLHEVDMKLIKKPEQPSSSMLRNNGRRFPPHFLHESWGDFLYWDSELSQT